MTRGWIVAISVLALGLSWLALDDITTGRQPSFTLEWLMVGATMAWFAGLGFRAWRSSSR